MNIMKKLNYYKKNRIKILAYMGEWYQKNKERKKQYYLKRKAEVIDEMLKQISKGNY